MLASSEQMLEPWAHRRAAASELLEVATRCPMEQQEPNPASAKEKAEGSRDRVSPDAKKSNKSDNTPELDGKNDITFFPSRKTPF